MNAESETIMGITVNADRIKVYEKPSEFSEVVCEIKKDTFLLIDEKDSTDDFYSICTETGIMGFCMKMFVELK